MIVRELCLPLNMPRRRYIRERSQMPRAEMLRRFLCTLNVLLLVCVAIPSSVYAQDKKLIEFGWDEPATWYLRQNIRVMETMPFDGVVFHAQIERKNRRSQALTNQVFRKRAIPWSALKSSVIDLRRTRFSQFRHNFLRINLDPSAVDWFDDFTIPLQNIQTAARITHQRTVVGIFFDLETYNSHAFNYSQQKYAATISFEEYAQQVQLRAQQMMQTLQTENPNIAVLLSFAYSNSIPPSDDILLSDFRYGLLRYFVDGLFIAAGPTITLIDGFEGSYEYTTSDEFERAYQWIHYHFKAFSAAPEAYLAKVKAGFGVWLDRRSHIIGWNTKNFSRNDITPRELEAVLITALRRSDQYVWLYSQQINWWSKQNIPHAYRQAVERARKAAKKNL